MSIETRPRRLKRMKRIDFDVEIFDEGKIHHTNETKPSHTKNAQPELSKMLIVESRKIRNHYKACAGSHMMNGPMDYSLSMYIYRAI